VDGEKGGNIDQQVFRGDIVWDATDNLDFRFNYQKDLSQFTEPRIQDAMFHTYNQPPSFGWAPDYVGMAMFYTLVGEDFQGNPVEPFFEPLNQQAGYPGGKVGKWENRSGTTLPNRYDTEQFTVDINWQVTDNIHLQFLTANTKQDSDSVVDWDNSQYDLVLDMNRSRFDTLTEEIQITGGNSRVDWLAGVYWWDQKTKNRNGRWQLTEFVQGVFPIENVLNHPACNPPGGVPDGYATCEQVWNRAVTGAFDNMSRTGQEGWAVFGEATVHLTDTWDLTLGLRHHDQTNRSQTMRAIPGVTPAKPTYPTQFHVGDPFIFEPAGPETKLQFDELTQRIAVQKQFNDNIMGYVGYSEGFRPGGISAPVIDGVRTEIPFGPSMLENTEIGMRSDLANGRLRFNWTIFETIWSDLQANSVVIHPETGEQLPQLMTQNVGSAEAKGIEIELTWRPTRNLDVNLGLGLLDTAYTDVLPGTYSGHIQIIPGETEFEQAPERSYTIGVQHTADLQNGGTFTTRFDYNYQGQFWRDAPFLRVDAYDAVPDGFGESGDWGILNMRLVYAPGNADWELAVFGTNLTDEYMLNSGFFHGIWGYDFATVSRPREVGASLTFRF
jgi:iron complex outermembrane receptor protein